MSLRLATLGDGPALDDVFARSYPKLLAQSYTPEILAAALPLMIKSQPALLGSGTYYVWEDGSGALLGAGGWTVDKVDPHLGHIRHLVTDPEALAKGVARGVINHCLSAAKAKGIKHMECWSTLNAEGFYQRMGFETLGPKMVMLDGKVGFPSLRMARAIR